jgi:hypothetical protein
VIETPNTTKLVAALALALLVQCGVSPYALAQ